MIVTVDAYEIKQIIKSHLIGACDFEVNIAEYVSEQIRWIIEENQTEERRAVLVKEVVKNINGYETVSHICTACNWNVSPGNKFCINCGRKLYWKFSKLF